MTARRVVAAALAGLALAALGASAAAAADYEWPVVRVIDGATLVVDAGADLPPELALLTVRVDGPVPRDGGDVVSEWLAGASRVVIRNPRFGGPDCECQVVAEVLIDGKFLDTLWLLRLLPVEPDVETPRPCRRSDRGRDGAG